MKSQMRPHRLLIILMIRQFIRRWSRGGKRHYKTAPKILYLCALSSCRANGTWA